MPPTTAGTRQESGAHCPPGNRPSWRERIELARQSLQEEIVGRARGGLARDDEPGPIEGVASFF